MFRGEGGTTMNEPTPLTLPHTLSRIGQISINARDLKRATAFYRDILGLKFLFEVPKMSFFDCGGVRLMLGIAEKPEFDHPASIIYYKVEDIHAAHDRLSALGVPFEGKPHLVAHLQTHDLWMAFFRDPEDNVAALMCEMLSKAA
jgi:methylmalonyl-CoA/ethylmalonyl-CoA epimerase